jgi:glycosyltransferase involved in cell wall biosynthesis
MLIGIDASRAFLENRTGIEEYAYQVIKNLTVVLHDQQVVLYMRNHKKAKPPIGDLASEVLGFELPKNWKIKVIKWPFFWTQAGLSLEMFFHPVAVLFIPAHTIPLIHPARTIVTIHGLEYEFCPKAYSLWERIYMRASIKKSCLWASKIISVSENTKKDLVRLYGVAESKINVIYEGCENNSKFQIPNSKLNQNDKNSKIKTLEFQSKFKIQNSNFLLFIGRIEERKNINNIIKAFEILKEKYKIEHKLVLAGKPGFGFDKIQNKIQTSRYNNQIISLGFVSEQEKWELLKNAEVFVFPTQYEGFGIPILEAQSVGCPVVASNNSSIPEVTSCHSERSEESLNITESLNIAGSFAVAQDDTCSALLVNPQSPAEIAEAIYKIISNKTFKKDLIKKGHENVKRFSWEKCGREVGEILKG